MRVELNAGRPAVPNIGLFSGQQSTGGPQESFSRQAGSTLCKESSDLAMVRNGLPLRPELPGSREFKECLSEHGLADQWPELKKTYYFMKAAHLKQKRDDGTPYYHHSTRVAINAVESFGVRDPDAIKGALLHDVVEDTPVTVNQIKSEFGERVAYFTELLTKPEKRPDQTYSQKTQAYLQRIEDSGSKDAIALKLADRLDNIEDTHLMPDREKITRYLGETSEHYVPLAERHFPSIAERLTARMTKINRWMSQS